MMYKTATSRPGEYIALISESQWTAVDGLKLRYVERGRRSGPDILVIACSRPGLAAFEYVWELLATTGRIVAIELPGFGASEGRPDLYTPDAMAHFVIKVIEAFHLRHPHFAAADMLMASALVVALNYPGALESLILGEATTPPECRTSSEKSAAALEKAQTDSWPDVRRRLHQILTPTLIVAPPFLDRPVGIKETLSTTLLRSRLAFVGEPVLPGCYAPPTWGSLVNNWVSGGYRMGG